MPHAAILGKQRSGKTTLGLSMARQYRQQGYALLVLDPHLNPAWRADWMTDDLERFLVKVKRSERCILFVDESGDGQLGRQPGFEYLLTQAHHRGHVTHYLSQYFAQVTPVVRANVQRLFMFRCGPKSSKEWGEQFAIPQLPALVAQLPKYHWIFLDADENEPRVQNLSPEVARKVIQ